MLCFISHFASFCLFLLSDGIDFILSWLDGLVFMCIIELQSGRISYVISAFLYVCGSMACTCYCYTSLVSFVYLVVD